ncbi:hypothetical protein HZI73_08885 [Vallitalea pronyensis]|uniref:Uncharacterized protein n=1 Tax=Vallitalea pronyensis TaxID=1348613 RepID=A0A8J8SGH9_9FIRM|nr:hypothetical protein [Vallitalea pronyensis]QUI22409.1 hypothetical protein HZI73_08885 [Vallitalea pronyensis]
MHTMAQVLEIINKIVPHLFSKRETQSEHKDKRLTIEEAIKRYEELSSL